MKDSKGKHRANPKALPAFVSIAKVDDGQQPIGSDYFSGNVTQARKVTGMVVEWTLRDKTETETVSFANHLDTNKSIINGAHRLPALKEAAVTSQFDIAKIITDYLQFRGNETEEIHTEVRTKYENGVFTFEHIGAMKVKALILDNNDQLATTRRTQLETITEYVAYVVGQPGSLKFESKEYGDLEDYPYVVGDEEANEQTLATLLTHVQNGVDFVDFPAISVTGEVSDTSRSYCVKIVATAGKALKIGQKYFVVGANRVEYV